MSLTAQMAEWYAVTQAWPKRFFYYYIESLNACTGAKTVRKYKSAKSSYRLVAITSHIKRNENSYERVLGDDATGSLVP